MSRSVSQINSDAQFDKKVCDHVDKTSPRMCVICIREGKVYLTGEKETVEIVRTATVLNDENEESPGGMTVQQLFSKLASLSNDDALLCYILYQSMN